MATTVAVLEAQLRADTRDFDRGVSRSEGRWKKFGGVLKKGALAAAAGVGTLGVISVRNASNLEEQMNKTSVVFRGSEGRILKWSETTAGALGISRREALEATGTFGNMLVPMGFARNEAGEMSTKMVELAADMASFNNADPSETLDSLRSGLAGETEPLRRFGVFLNDARLKAEAMNMGIYDGVGALTAQEKAQATYSIILKDTKDAQGDFDRTSGSLANQQRILKARFEDVSAKLGARLLPMVVKVFEKILQFIEWADGVNGLDRFKDAWARVVKVWDAVKLNFNRFRLWMMEKTLQLVLGILEPFSHLPGKLGKWARDAKDKVNPQLDKIRKQIDDLEESARRAANKKYNIHFTTNAGRVKSQIEDFRSTLFRGGERGDFGSFGLGATSLVALGRQLQSMGFQVGEHPAFGGVAPVHVPGSYHYQGRALDINWPGAGEPAKLDWLYSRLRRMPGVKELLWRTAGHFDHLHVAMAKGGIFTKPWTGMMTVAERGKPEGFIPLPAGGLGGDVYNFNGPVFDGEKVVRWLEQQKKKHKRRGG